MSKDFDSWNSQKKNIHNDGKNKFYHPRDIWWCSLGINVGFEQDGTGKEYQRPAVILRGFSKHVCLVVPLTTSQKTNPFHIAVGIVDGKTAFAITSQIRLIDTKRLINKLAVLDKATFDITRKAVKALL